MRNVLVNKSVQIFVAVLLAAILVLSLNHISAKKIIELYIAMALVLFLYRLFGGYIPSVPLLVKTLAFFALINTLIIIVKIDSVSLFPYRILAPLVLIICFIQYFREDHEIFHWRQIKLKPFLLFFLIWVCYGLLSLIWVKNITEGVKGLLFLAIGVSFIFIFTFCFTKFKDYLQLYYIWLAALIILIGIGMWETITGHHLATSSLVHARIGNRHIPTSVFYNQNDFSMYLTISIYFIIAFIQNAKGYLIKIFGFILLLLSLYLIYQTSSRANYLALVFSFFLWILLVLNRRKRKIFILIFIPVAVVVGIYIEKTTSIIARFHSEFLFNGSSTGIRINLIRNSLKFLRDTYSFGVGSGNAKYYMAHYEKFPTKMIYNVHNWWIQILVEYGVLIFVGYLLVFISLVILLYRLYKRAQTNQQKMICTALLGGLFAFPLASISPSSIMGFKFQWVFIAFAIGYLNLMRVGKDRGSSTEYR